MNALYRGVLGGVIVVLLAAGVVAALIVGPAEDPAAVGSPPTTTARDAPPAEQETVPPTQPSITAPALSRGEASRSLCREITAALQAVFGGRVVAGGQRLSGAVDTYADTADPTIVDPARRMLSTALDGDFGGSLQAADDANTACTRLGFPIDIGGGAIPCDFPPC